MGRFAKPWQQMNQKIQLDMLNNSFTSRCTLLDGEQKGDIWGIQSWATYKRTGKNTSVIWEEDDNIEFYLPTLQYFIEFPFRIFSAEIIADAGETTIDGKTYKQVFVS